MMNIPVVDLMQVAHPGYRAFSQGEDMQDILFPAFMDYAIQVCNRFKHYAYENGKNLISENSINQIADYIHDLNETDDPAEVFPLRHKLQSLCLDFKDHCNGMGRCFKSPENMSQFYTELGDLVLHMTYKFAGVVEE
tara:strand:+ start:780 stop:1190 length:411 start_codon:yes stop_codon:yes gene_type:complete